MLAMPNAAGVRSLGDLFGMLTRRPLTNLTRDQYRQLFKLLKDYNFEINDKYQML